MLAVVQLLECLSVAAEICSQVKKLLVCAYVFMSGHRQCVESSRVTV